MKPMPGYLYSCIWDVDTNATFYNVIDSVSETSVRGHAIAAKNNSRPISRHIISWPLALWNDPRNNIKLLGPVQDFPEYLL